MRLSYANVVSTLALFLAIGGVGYAAAAWTGADIVDGSLTGADVQDNSLLQSDLGTDSVAFDEVAFNSVVSGHIRDGQVRTEDVANGTLRSEDAGPTFAAPRAIDADQLGGAAAYEYERKVRRVVAAANGAILSSDGVFSVSRLGTGAYSVRFGADVAACAPMATVVGVNERTWISAQRQADPNVINVYARRTGSLGYPEGHDVPFSLIAVC